jgi:hypothetical protein
MPEEFLGGASGEVRQFELFEFHRVSFSSVIHSISRAFPQGFPEVASSGKTRREVARSGKSCVNAIAYYYGL